MPTLGKMDQGFYRGVEPVAVVSMSNTAEVRGALQTILLAEIQCPHAASERIAPPVLLKYAGVKRWSEFERGMKFWTVEDKDGRFQISGQRKQPDGDVGR